MTVNQITPHNAFDILKNQKNSILIDVRTLEEVNFVGAVDASNFENRMLFLLWQILPQMQLNKNFSSELLAKLDPSQELIFICRTGGRSNNSAELAIQIGFNKCHNIINGFEGDLNNQSQRGKINGWKASNLPWRQS